MYINTIFILYGVALLISLVCLVFIGLIFVRKKDRSNETYIAVRRFAIIVMLTDILYFVFYYREVVLGKFELALPFRIIDYTLYTATFLCWILILGTLRNSEKTGKAIISGIVLSIIRLVSSLIVTSVFMDQYYNIEHPVIQKYWTSIEMLFIILTALIIIYCSIRVITETVSSLHKKYVISVSALVLFWSTVQGIIDAGLYAGKYGISAWSLEIPDFTGATLFLMNLATCIFVFKEDFSPLFFNETKTAVSDIADKFDAIAASHKLTVREREVMELIYKGYTNPDIGEELYITINTVKKHTHNIFEKLDVSNRMEVVHLINSWNRK